MAVADRGFVEGSQQSRDSGEAAVLARVDKRQPGVHEGRHLLLATEWNTAVMKDYVIEWHQRPEGPRHAAASGKQTILLRFGIEVVDERENGETHIAWLWSRCRAAGHLIYFERPS